MRIAAAGLAVCIAAAGLAVRIAAAGLAVRIAVVAGLAASIAHNCAVVLVPLVLFLGGVPAACDMIKFAA